MHKPAVRKGGQRIWAVARLERLRSRRIRSCKECGRAEGRAEHLRDRDMQAARNTLRLLQHQYYGAPRPQYLCGSATSRRRVAVAVPRRRRVAAVVPRRQLRWSCSSRRRRGTRPWWRWRGCVQWCRSLSRHDSRRWWQRRRRIGGAGTGAGGRGADGGGRGRMRDNKFDFVVL